MTYYQDLSPVDYDLLYPWTSKLLAIGWLEPYEDCTKGAVDSGVIQRIAELLNQHFDYFKPQMPLGYHTCGFCKYSGTKTGLTEVLNGFPVKVGYSFLFVPSPCGKVFVAPSLFIHYIVHHQYRPPERFLQAVTRCPDIGSWKYRLEMTLRGVRFWSWLSYLPYLPELIRVNTTNTTAPAVRFSPERHDDRERIRKERWLKFHAPRNEEPNCREGE